MFCDTNIRITFDNSLAYCNRFNNVIDVVRSASLLFAFRRSDNLDHFGQDSCLCAEEKEISRSYTG